MSPRDNFDTSPNIIKIRKAGNVSRLNMEIAMLPTDHQVQDQNSGGGAASGASIAVAEIANQTGGFGGGGGTCFTGETIIFVPFEYNGEFTSHAYDWVQICDVRAGQHVLGFDEQQNLAVGLITDVNAHEATSILRFWLKRPDSMSCFDALHITDEHLVWDGKQFRAADTFQPGDTLYDRHFQAIEIVEITRAVFDAPITVYSIETTIETHFANNVAVHNAKLPGEEV